MPGFAASFLEAIELGIHCKNVIPGLTKNKDYGISRLLKGDRSMKAWIYPTVNIECDGCDTTERYEFAGERGLAVTEADMVGGLERQGWTFKGTGDVLCFKCTEPERLRVVEEYKRKRGLC
jgi:hypothetical protein